jgi:hypothetical protein
VIKKNKQIEAYDTRNTFSLKWIIEKAIKIVKNNLHRKNVPISDWIRIQHLEKSLIWNRIRNCVESWNRNRIQNSADIGIWKKDFGFTTMVIFVNWWH